MFMNRPDKRVGPAVGYQLHRSGAGGGRDGEAEDEIDTHAESRSQVEGPEKRSGGTAQGQIC